MINPPIVNPLLAKGLKLSHLRIIAAFAETLHIGQAAHLLGITQPAASRLLAEIERICGYRVHVRSGRGVELTEVGQALAQRATRVLVELRDTAREIDDLGKGTVGQVAIGSVTAPALDIIMPAVRAARLGYPGLQIDVTVASSDVLFDQLIAGKLDFAFGRIPEGADKSLVDIRIIADEPVQLVVRRAHPLAGQRGVSLPGLTEYDWVLPSRGSPMTEAVLARLTELGSPWPVQRMTTSSFLLTLALLQQTNSIAPLSSAVAGQFASQPDTALTILDIDLGITVGDFGIMTRKGGTLPLPARNLLGIIEQNAGL